MIASWGGQLRACINKLLTQYQINFSGSRLQKLQLVRGRARGGEAAAVQVVQVYSIVPSCAITRVKTAAVFSVLYTITIYTIINIYINNINIYLY